MLQIHNKLKYIYIYISNTINNIRVPHCIHNTSMFALDSLCLPLLSICSCCRTFPLIYNRNICNYDNSGMKNTPSLHGVWGRRWRTMATHSRCPQVNTAEEISAFLRMWSSRDLCRCTSVWCRKRWWDSCTGTSEPADQSESSWANETEVKMEVKT